MGKDSAFPVRVSQEVSPKGFVFLRAGQELTVRYGSEGTQAAQVVGPSRSLHTENTFKVMKYRANSDRWTKPVVVRGEDIVEL